MQQRGKSWFEKDSVRTGDLVLLVKENLPTNKCPLGKIVKVHSGKDNKIRVVKNKNSKWNL